MHGVAQVHSLPDTEWDSLQYWQIYFCIMEVIMEVARANTAGTTARKDPTVCVAVMLLHSMPTTAYHEVIEKLHQPGWVSVICCQVEKRAW